jgi:hypothetical protein
MCACRGWATGIRSPLSAEVPIRPTWSCLAFIRLSRCSGDYYLDEFTFRFNRRRSKARGLLFHRLAQQAVAVGPAPYRQIIATNGPAPALGVT